MVFMAMFFSSKQERVLPDPVEYSKGAETEYRRTASWQANWTGVLARRKGRDALKRAPTSPKVNNNEKRTKI
jgi:hypothetical protein